jgi:hypothetical protein|tara:strand:+ start:864 stop:1034 length:171 start_codon:yes stop_codon:yes gene_type:complete
LSDDEEDVIFGDVKNREEMGPRRSSIIRIEACSFYTGTMRPSRGTWQTLYSWIGHL